MDCGKTMVERNCEETVFEQALDIAAPEAREGYLRGACGSDKAMFDRLQGLLQSHDRAGRFIDPRPPSSKAFPDAESGSPASVLAPESLPLRTEKPGDCIGRYKLLQKIGEGGCGVVYLAEQEEPVRRRVALKIIKLGMDTRQVIARFEAERQTLALMDHPNIAKIYDAGATDSPTILATPARVPACPAGSDVAGRDAGAPGDAGAALPAGRPSFVMELVRGVKITKYCDEKKLPTRQRLELFIQVCGAIQHAHQKGIIHRDIKPSNILVTINDGPAAAGCPKVIDLGIAKATTDQRLRDTTVFTPFEQFMGTPAYMSPEQAVLTSLDVDTRSDIYGLGVLLYELLTGKTPFNGEELLASGLDQMRQTIRDKEPPPPSMRLSTLPDPELTTTAQLRGLDPRKLISQVRGDLDWIVMKCLEKDRTRRFETANGLAVGIRHHLGHAPVVARPPSKLYRFRELVRRNKLTFAAAGAVAAALIVGLGLSTWLLLRERQARQRAVAAETDSKREASKSQQVAQVLKDMLKRVDPSRALGRDATMVREILDDTAQRVARDLTGQPDIEAELRGILGNTYYGLEEYAKAEQMHRESLRLRRSVFGETNQFVAAPLSDLGNALCMEDRQPEAEILQRQALAMRRQLFGAEHTEVANSLVSLADTLTDERKLPEAESLLREALAIQRRLLGDDHPDVAVSLSYLGRVLRLGERLTEAEVVYREALALARRQSGAESPSLAEPLYRLGFVLRRQGKLAETQDLWREALGIQRKLLGSEHPEVASTLDTLASVLCDRGRPAEAETLYRQRLLDLRGRLPSDDPLLASALASLTIHLLNQERFADAETPARECLIAREKKNPDGSEMFHSRALLGGSLLGQKNYEEAERWLLSGYEGLKQRGGKVPGQDDRLGQALHWLVHLYNSTGRSEQAAEWEKELTEWRRSQLDVYRRQAERGGAGDLNSLARMLATCNDPAVRDGRSALTFAEKAVAATARRDPDYLDTLAAACAEAGDFTRAASIQTEAIALLSDAKMKEGFQSRLKLYQSNVPYRRH